MPAGTQTYERNLQSAKAYGSSAVIGSHGYNPTITRYYDSAGNLMRTEEVSGDVMYVTTISGLTFAGGNKFTAYWPGYSYKTVENAWTETTVS